MQYLLAKETQVHSSLFTFPFNARVLSFVRQFKSFAFPLHFCHSGCWSNGLHNAHAFSQRAGSKQKVNATSVRSDHEALSLPPAPAPQPSCPLCSKLGKARCHPDDQQGGESVAEVCALQSKMWRVYPAPRKYLPCCWEVPSKHICPCICFKGEATLWAATWGWCYNYDGQNLCTL